MSNTKEVRIAAILPYNWASELEPEEARIAAAWLLSPSGLGLEWGQAAGIPLPTGGFMTRYQATIYGIEAVSYPALDAIVNILKRQPHSELLHAQVRDLDNNGEWETIIAPKPNKAMVAGARYEIRYRNPNHRRDRLDVMDYLGDQDNYYVFSARPIAGTQHMPMDWVSSLTLVAKTTPIRLNRLAP